MPSRLRRHRLSGFATGHLAYSSAVWAGQPVRGRMTENELIKIRVQAKIAYDIIAPNMGFRTVPYEHLSMAQQISFEKLARHFLEDPECSECGTELICPECCPDDDLEEPGCPVCGTSCGYCDGTQTLEKLREEEKRESPIRP
jgi:hypothetical protein